MFVTPAGNPAQNSQETKQGNLHALTSSPEAEQALDSLLSRVGITSENNSTLPAQRQAALLEKIFKKMGMLKDNELSADELQQVADLVSGPSSDYPAIISDELTSIKDNREELGSEGDVEGDVEGDTDGPEGEGSEGTIRDRLLGMSKDDLGDYRKEIRYSTSKHGNVNEFIATASDAELQEVFGGAPVAPSETLPASDEAAESDMPESDTPESDTPESDMPESDMPESDMPESDMPESDMPESEMPESEMPDSEMPDSDAPPVTSGGGAPAVGDATQSDDSGSRAAGSESSDAASEDDSEPESTRSGGGAPRVGDATQSDDSGSRAAGSESSDAASEDDSEPESTRSGGGAPRVGDATGAGGSGPNTSATEPTREREATPTQATGSAQGVEDVTPTGSVKTEFDTIDPGEGPTMLVDSEGYFTFTNTVDDSFLPPDVKAGMKKAVDENFEKLDFFKDNFRTKEDAYQFLVHMANLESARGKALHNDGDAAGSDTGGSGGYLHLHNHYGYQPESFGGRPLNTEGWSREEAASDYSKYTTLAMRHLDAGYKEGGGQRGEAGIASAVSYWWLGNDNPEGGKYYLSALANGSGVNHNTGANFN